MTTDKRKSNAKCHLLVIPFNFLQQRASAPVKVVLKTPTEKTQKQTHWHMHTVEIQSVSESKRKWPFGPLTQYISDIFLLDSNGRQTLEAADPNSLTCKSWKLSSFIPETKYRRENHNISPGLNRLKEYLILLYSSDVGFTPCWQCDNQCGFIVSFGVKFAKRNIR